MNVRTWYVLTFSLAQHHKWSLTELNELYPFERDIYVDLLNQHLEEVRKEEEKARAKHHGG